MPGAGEAACLPACSCWLAAYSCRPGTPGRGAAPSRAVIQLPVLSTPSTLAASRRPSGGERAQGHGFRPHHHPPTQTHHPPCLDGSVGACRQAGQQILGIQRAQHLSQLLVKAVLKGEERGVEQAGDAPAGMGGRRAGGWVGGAETPPCQRVQGSYWACSWPSAKRHQRLGEGLRVACRAHA